jgi:hypothetical protein
MQLHVEYYMQYSVECIGRVVFSVLCSYSLLGELCRS